MGLFGKSKKKSKHQASTSEPRHPPPPPLSLSPSYLEANYYRDHYNYTNNHYPQPWPFADNEPAYHRGAPPHQQPDNGYPIWEPAPQHYPPPPSWVPGPIDQPPLPPPPPSYYVPPPGRSVDEDPNAQCMIM